MRAVTAAAQAASRRPSRRPVGRSAALVVALALALGVAGAASAHAPTFAVYSKYEATTRGRSVAFVFALDRKAVLGLLEQQAGAPGPVDVAALPSYRAFFSSYFFDRLSVGNNGVACRHPATLDRFLWDAATSRVLAVTRFDCPGDLGELTIRCLVTHDMPTSHELVGDLMHEGAQERSVFVGDSVEARVSLQALAASGAAAGKREGQPRPRGRFAVMGEPDRERRYDAFAAAALDGSFADVASLPPGRWAAIRYFILQGVWHIFSGYDHVLFILTLLLVVASWRKLAVIVTSFTVAHSLTLAVATLGWVTPPARVIEPLIAATVLAVAAHALLRPQASARAWATFAFGLVHGFGLSAALRMLGLSGGELGRALFGFNAGVEAGQLLIVLPLFPLVLRLRRHPALYRRIRQVICGGVALLAVVWIVQRLRAG